MNKLTMLILTLLNIKGIGNVKAFKIVQNLKISDALEIYTEIMKELNRINPEITNIQYLEAELSAENEMKLAVKHGIHLVNLYDSLYPSRLSHIKNKPMLLYCKGNLDLLNHESIIAIVGTRIPSEYGMKYARSLSEYLSDKDVVIVSGLAKGIDTEAHLGTKNNSYKTIAVLGQGLLHKIRPKENEYITNLMVKEGGLIVSEYKLKESPNRGHYINRNRIQSGLSDGVIVIESSSNGGTMHTANFAIQQHRKLAALDHPTKFLVNNKQALGNHKLFTDGLAQPLYSQASMNIYLKETQINKEKLIHSTTKNKNNTSKQLSIEDIND